MFRYPNGRLQPYIGFGPGIFFARVNITEQGFEASQSNTRVGVNAKIGAEFFITRHVAVFGEWKYNWVRFNFDETLGIAATYNMHLVAGGSAIISEWTNSFRTSISPRSSILVLAATTQVCMRG